MIFKEYVTPMGKKRVLVRTPDGSKILFTVVSVPCKGVKK